jgi:hypothetical protein
MGSDRYEGVSTSFWTSHLERELQMLHLSATRCSCIAILWVSLVSFAAITLCVASQREFIVLYFVMTQSRNFWIYPHTLRFFVTATTNQWTSQKIQKLILSIISVGFWRWCVGIERIVLLDFIHHLVSQKLRN